MRSPVAALVVVLVVVRSWVRGIWGAPGERRLHRTDGESRLGSSIKPSSKLFISSVAKKENRFIPVIGVDCPARRILGASLPIHTGNWC